VPLQQRFEVGSGVDGGDDGGEAVAGFGAADGADGDGEDVLSMPVWSLAESLGRASDFGSSRWTGVGL